MNDFAENVTCSLAVAHPALWRLACDGDMQSIKSLMMLAVREGYALGLGVNS